MLWFRHAVLASCLAACATDPGTPRGAEAGVSSVLPVRDFAIAAGKPVADLPGERHLRNVRQLTFDGENAEAYWSGDGRKLIFQRRRPGEAADQIYILDLTTGQQRMVSTGTGRTTCSYFLQGDRSIVFASTHHFGAEPPPVVKVERGRYVWAVHREYDLFLADVDGKNLRRITDQPGYDAEATVCPVTGAIVFTSVRDGDLELYVCEADGSHVRRVTNRPGYDGGAFFSHDGKKLVLRSAYPTNQEQASADRNLLLNEALVQPSHMEITVCDRDGGNFRRITDNGAANFAPYWHPDDRRILFASNWPGMAEAQRTGNHAAARNFDLFLIGEDGEGQEQVTHCPEFDGFPMFSPDGKLLAFASNRYARERGETNIFVAEWVENPPAGTR